MATHAPIMGAQTRAPLFPVPVLGSEPHLHLKAPPPRVANRRDLLCFAGAATALGAAVATGAVALASEAIAAPNAAPTAFIAAEARYHAAVARFDALPVNLEGSDPARFGREEDVLAQAVRTVDRTRTANLSEFARSFLIAFDAGYSMPNEDVLDRLIADAKRLTGAA